jgi:protocatechuate 3,4-dioxygenase alpha subunit
MTSAQPTPSQTIGPFFSFGLDWMDATVLVPAEHPDALGLRGRVLDGGGQAVPDGVVEIWDGSAFGRSLTDPEGAFEFTLCKPAPRRAGHAPHIDVSVFARGLTQRAVTRIYFPDEVEANAADPVLALVEPERRVTLVASADGGPRALRFDVCLQGAEETVFFAY